MIRVEYDSEDLSGHFDCPICGKVVELPGNVHIYREGGNGTERTYPDAKNSIRAHYHYDANAHVDLCPVIGDPDVRIWQAVNKQTGEVVAHGRISIEVDQYEPK